MGVSNDPEQKNARFATKQEFNFSLLCDVDLAMSVAYGAAADTDARGSARIGVIIDPDGNISHWWPKVSSKNFPQTALDSLP